MTQFLPATVPADPTEVSLAAAPCVERGHKPFDSAKCQLATRHHCDARSGGRPTAVLCNQAHLPLVLRRGARGLPVLPTDGDRATQS